MGTVAKVVPVWCRCPSAIEQGRYVEAGFSSCAPCQCLNRFGDLQCREIRLGKRRLKTAATFESETKDLSLEEKEFVGRTRVIVVLLGTITDPSNTAYAAVHGGFEVLVNQLIFVWDGEATNELTTGFVGSKNILTIRVTIYRKNDIQVLLGKLRDVRRFRFGKAPLDHDSGRYKVRRKNPYHPSSWDNFDCSPHQSSSHHPSVVDSFANTESPHRKSSTARHPDSLPG